MQMCPECERIYDESDYAHCPYCDGTLDPDDYENDEGDGYDEFADQDWEYIYDESGSSVCCPNVNYCNCWELRFRDGQCYCPKCDTYFTDGEIEDHAGPWTHS